MEEQDKVEPEYVKGFNEGYTIARDKPELAERLAGIDILSGSWALRTAGINTRKSRSGSVCHPG
jgi:hypothetical protein